MLFSFGKYLTIIDDKKICRTGLISQCAAMCIDVTIFALVIGLIFAIFRTNLASICCGYDKIDSAKQELWQLISSIEDSKNISVSKLFSIFTYIADKYQVTSCLIFSWIVGLSLYGTFILASYILLSGSTIGQKLIGIRLVQNKDYKHVANPYFLTIRMAASILSIIPLGLGIIWPAFDSRKRTWHDILTGTILVKVRHATTIEQQND